MSRNRGRFGGDHKSGEHHNRSNDKQQRTSGSNGNNETNQAKRRPNKPNWVDKGTLIVLLFTLGAACYAGYEADRLADGTDRLVASAGDTAKRQLRAYVGILPGDVENFGDVANQSFTFIRKNYGATPAYDVTWSTQGQAVIQKNGQIPIAEAPPAVVSRLVTIFPTMELPFHVIGRAMRGSW